MPFFLSMCPILYHSSQEIMSIFPFQGDQCVFPLMFSLLLSFSEVMDYSFTIYCFIAGILIYDWVYTILIILGLSYLTQDVFFFCSFIHLLVHFKMPWYFTTEQYPIIQMYHISFIHSWLMGIQVVSGFWQLQIMLL